MLLLHLSTSSANAQSTIATYDRNLQFSGYVVSFYNMRFYDVAEKNRDKNRMNLDFAVFRVQHSNQKGIRSEIQINIPALFSTDPTDEFLMQATAEWRNRKGDGGIQMGYDKLPFSWASILPQNESAFLQRAECIRGKSFNRRDLGVTLWKSFFNRRLTATGGIYTGEGINSITGDNDPNGKYLYAGRMEASYPARYRNEELDMDNSPKPRLLLGGSAMYTEKTVTTGTDYPILTVNGKKISSGADITASWRGFSLHGEWVNFKILPNDSTVLLGKPTHFFRAQGVIAQCAYHIQKIKTTVALRYDEFNPNDLILGDTRQTASIALNYLFDGMDNVIKVHYFHRLKAENALEPWSENQIRIGWQIRF
jgi:hypothetical protein